MSDRDVLLERLVLLTDEEAVLVLSASMDATGGEANKPAALWADLKDLGFALFDARSALSPTDGEPEPRAVQSDAGWIEWKGGECPVPADAIGRVRFRVGRETKGGSLSLYCWRHKGAPYDIIAYRLDAPPPGQEAKLRERVKQLEEALTPSADTKADYIGEFYFSWEVPNPSYDEDADSEDAEPQTHTERVYVPWTTIKQIMAAIFARSALGGGAA